MFSDELCFLHLEIKDKINEALSVTLICVITLKKNDKWVFKYIGGKQDNNTNCSHDMTWIFNTMIVLVFVFLACKQELVKKDETTFWTTIHIYPLKQKANKSNLVFYCVIQDFNILKY